VGRSILNGQRTIFDAQEYAVSREKLMLPVP
jgi:hypothetical protein